MLMSHKKHNIEQFTLIKQISFLSYDFINLFFNIVNIRIVSKNKLQLSSQSLDIFSLLLLDEIESFTVYFGSTGCIWHGNTDD